MHRNIPSNSLIQKYAFVINMVSVISVGKLVQDLRKSNNRISKQTVINEGETPCSMSRRVIP